MAHLQLHCVRSPPSEDCSSWEAAQRSWPDPGLPLVQVQVLPPQAQGLLPGARRHLQGLPVPLLHLQVQPPPPLSVRSAFRFRHA
jgi:hypothetical protein